MRRTWYEPYIPSLPGNRNAGDVKILRVELVAGPQGSEGETDRRLAGEPIGSGGTENGGSLNMLSKCSTARRATGPTAHQGITHKRKGPIA